jgi:adenylate kinase
MTPQSFILIGRAGAGKGTQAKQLEATLKGIHDRTILHIETGALLRIFNQGEGYAAKQAKIVMEQGFLMPEFMPVYMWAKFLVEQYTGQEHLIFDGTPRKLLEAELLGSTFPFYNLGKPFVIYLDIEHEESYKRLSLRAKEGRKDDTPEAVERRQVAFEQEVKPVVEWYRTNPSVTFLDIDGHGTIEEVHERIVKGAGLS